MNTTQTNEEVSTTSNQTQPEVDPGGITFKYLNYIVSKGKIICLLGFCFSVNNTFTQQSEMFEQIKWKSVVSTSCLFSSF